VASKISHVHFLSKLKTGKLMHILKLLILAGTLLILFACGKPVPPEKSSYVGDWQSPNMSLKITQDGNVVYHRVRGNATTSIDAPIKDFIGNDFEVGISSITTTFVVSSLPHQEDGVWKMTVDGVTLSKVQ
jgi:hypothetical protein